MVYIILDTKDSHTGEAHNASFNLTTYADGYDEYKLSLQNVILPNLVYPINSNNNTIVFQEDGVANDLVATLTPGYYTATTILVELKDSLEAAGANLYTITYSDSTFKLNFATSGTSLKFTSDSTALKVIGFPSTGTDFASSLISSYPIRLDGSQYLNIIASLPSNNISSDNIAIYHRVPLNVSFGALLFYSPNYEVSLPVKPDSVISLDLRLTDDEGNLFVLPANAQVQYTFKLV